MSKKIKLKLVHMSEEAHRCSKSKASALGLKYYEYLDNILLDDDKKEEKKIKRSYNVKW